MAYGPTNQCSWTLRADQLKYYWEPGSSCSNPLVAFDASTMCTLMKDRGEIAFVGDSVTQLAAFTLNNVLLKGLNEKCQRWIPAIKMVPNCFGLKISIFRNDYVTLAERSLPFQEVWIRNLTDRVCLLVLNRGAHYTDDAVFIRGVNSTLHYVTTKHPTISIIWRNTPHGVPDYYDHAMSPPLHTPPLLDYARAPWDYGKFKHQNQLVEALIDQYYPHVLYLDVFTATVLRRDGHLDPMHLCMPGVMDTWAQFMYNALLILAEQQ